MTIVSPPRLVGINTVAKFLSVSRYWLYDHGTELPGYVGKIGGRHTWNLPELIASTFDSDASLQVVLDRLADPHPADPLDAILCAVPNCDYVAEQVGLCDIHLRRLFTAWRRASRSTVVTMQLVAMCRWIVERNAHLVLPADFDPWHNVCMTPGCDNSTNIRGEHAWHGPLCKTCSAKFWGFAADRPWPRTGYTDPPEPGGVMTDTDAPVLEAWRNRIIGYDEVTPEDLEANPSNPKIHDQIQQNAMTALLDDVGFVVPIIVNKPTMRIVDGHMRAGLVAARGAGLIPVAYVDLTPDEETEILALLDPVGRLAGYDGDALAAVLAGLSTTVDLAEVLANLAPATINPPPVMNTDPDVIPDWPAPVSERGDIWLLGPHRVMCGDSTSSEDLDALMAGAEAQSMVTDPPYGVSYGDTVAWRRSLGKSQRPQADSDVHNDGEVDATVLWAGAFPIWIRKLRKQGSAVYCWGAGGQQQIDMGIALRDAGVEIHGSVIWVKSSFSFSRADHKYRHEPCWYGWRADGTHEWCGPNNESSVWEYPKPSSSPDHPTQKPVELIRRCIRNVTAPGGLTLDPFLGSGTAVLAAHLEGRVCYGMEITPRYVDIVCKRYELATGVLPVKAATGEAVTFTEEAA